MGSGSNMFSLDGVMKAGTEMMGVASSTFQRAMKVQEVTSTKDEDQSAFSLNELVQACHKDGEEARAIAGALLKKVSSTNPLVKWKALRAIRYICQNCPSTQFKKACGGPNASVIRESTTWTGTPHPRLGNSLNMRVREAAKETLDEVFKATAPPTTFMGNGSGGVGGSSSSGGGGGSSHLRSRIQGYGSTTGGKIQGSVGTSLTGFSSSSSGSKYVGFGSDDVNNGTGHWQKFASSHSQSNGSSGAPYATSSANALGGSSSGGQSAPAANPAVARATIGDEASVVSTLCNGSGGGVNPRATPEAIRLFLLQASQLDPEVIALELTHKLFNAKWQERVRALDGMHAVIESVDARGGGHPLQPTVDSLSSVTDAFKGVTNHESAAVRSAAARVLRALKVEDTGGQSMATGASVAAVAPVDLLGGFEDDSVPGGDGIDALGGVADNNVSTGGVEDLMGGLDLLESAPAPQTANTNGSAAPSAAAVQTGASGAPDMFAGLKVASSGPAPSAPQTTTPAAAAPVAGGGVDLLDFGCAPAEPQTAGAATGLDDLFSDWSTAPAATAAPAAPAPAAGAVNGAAVATPPAVVDPMMPSQPPRPAMQAMQHPQEGAMRAQPQMHGQPAPGMFQPAGFGQATAPGTGVGAGMQPQMHAGAGMGMHGGLGAMGTGGAARPTQNAFMHTSGELSRANNKDAFDFVNDAMLKKMLRQRVFDIFRLSTTSASRLDRFQPVLASQVVQQAFHGGGPKPSGSSPTDSGPQTDAFTEKLQEKGVKELEALTSKPEDDADDWIKNYDTGEIGGPVGSRKGAEPTRFGDWEQKGRCTDF